MSEESDVLIAEYTGQLANYTRWLTFATWMAALLSAIGVGISIWIAYSTNELKTVAAEQLGEMRKSSEQVERSIKAANDQVSQMQASNRLVELGQTRQLRSYMILDNQELVDAVSKTMKAKLFVKNVGQTPAYNVWTSECEDIVPDVYEVKSPTDLSTELKTWPQESTIGSGLSESLTFDRDNCKDKSREYSAQDIKDFQRGSKIYVFWGATYYRDIFSEARYFRFCRYFKNGNVQTWYSCENHNDAN
jgi:hypothetical protein